MALQAPLNSGINTSSTGIFSCVSTAPSLLQAFMSVSRLPFPFPIGLRWAPYGHHSPFAEGSQLFRTDLLFQLNSTTWLSDIGQATISSEPQLLHLHRDIRRIRQNKYKYNAQHRVGPQEWILFRPSQCLHHLKSITLMSTLWEVHKCFFPPPTSVLHGI